MNNCLQYTSGFFVAKAGQNCNPVMEFTSEFQRVAVTPQHPLQFHPLHLSSAAPRGRRWLNQTAPYCWAASTFSSGPQVGLVASRGVGIRRTLRPVRSTLHSFGPAPREAVRSKAMTRPLGDQVGLSS